MLFTLLTLLTLSSGALLAVAWIMGAGLAWLLVRAVLGKGPHR